MERKRIIKKILKNKANGQLYVIIDKKSNFKEGDYVEILLK